jgi:hypothetical protein
MGRAARLIRGASRAILGRMATESIDAEVAEGFLGANARRVFRL